MPTDTTIGHSWRGIFPIPVTPFTPDQAVDHDGLRRQIEFCIAAGCHGIVYPGVASEFFTLTDAERDACCATVIDAVAGRVPVVIGVAGASTPVAARHAAHARDLGADAVMATLPYVKHFFEPDTAFILNYYQRIAEHFRGPIILQNARIGFPVPPAVLREIVAAVPQIRYVKEETAPSTHRLSATIAALGDAIDGVFAGIGGIYLVNELGRGAAGSMPAPGLVDLLCRAHNLHITGDANAAQATLDALSPLFTLELLYNVSLFKEILVQRGIIAHRTCRVPSPNLDQHDRGEIGQHLRALGL